MCALPPTRYNTVQLPSSQRCSLHLQLAAPPSPTPDRRPPRTTWRLPVRASSAAHLHLDLHFLAPAPICCVHDRHLAARSPLKSRRSWLCVSLPPHYTSSPPSPTIPSVCLPIATRRQIYHRDPFADQTWLAATAVQARAHGRPHRPPTPPTYPRPILRTCRVMPLPDVGLAGYLVPEASNGVGRIDASLTARPSAPQPPFPRPHRQASPFLVWRLLPIAMLPRRPMELAQCTAAQQLTWAQRRPPTRLADARRHRVWHLTGLAVLRGLGRVGCQQPPHHRSHPHR